MAKYFVGLILLVSVQAFAGPRLYVFDCGAISLASMEKFGLADNESDVRELFVPCYLIEHEKGLFLWDGGLPKGIADAGTAVAIEGGSLRYEQWIADQLASMKLSPSDITFAAYSHLHFDHAGAANTFKQSNVIMQQKEWDAAFGEGGEFVDTTLFDGLKDAKLTFIDGDYDVFGDGSVRLIFAPGHTAGHQVLLVSLESSGKILLSGDLYHTRANRELRRVPIFNDDASQTLASMEKIEQLLKDSGATLWIEHDKAFADTLRKAPEFYD